MNLKYTLRKSTRSIHLFNIFKIGIVNEGEVRFEEGVISFDFLDKVITITNGDSKLTAGFIVESNKKTAPFLGKILTDGYDLSLSKKSFGLNIRIEVAKNDRTWMTHFNPDILAYGLSELFRISVNRLEEEIFLVTESNCANLALIVGFVCYMYHFRYWNPMAGA